MCEENSSFLSQFRQSKKGKKRENLLKEKTSPTAAPSSASRQNQHEELHRHSRLPQHDFGIFTYRHLLKSHHHRVRSLISPPAKVRWETRKNRGLPKGLALPTTSNGRIYSCWAGRPEAPTTEGKKPYQPPNRPFTRSQ